MKFLRTLAAVPLFTMGLWAADSAGTGITTPESLFPQLDAILKHTVSQSPAMVTRATEMESAENDRAVARASLLPTAGGYLTYVESSDNRSDQPETVRVRKTYYNFAITQPIFFWGERRNNDRMGAIRLQLAQKNYKEGYRLLAQEVRGTYLRLIGDKLRAQRASLSNALSAAQLKRGEAQLARKDISEAQMFGIRLDAERAQILDERTRFEYENNKASFARLTGMPVLRDEEIPDAIPAVQPQNEVISQLLAGFLAQKDKPTIRAETARQNLEVARLTLANDKKRLYPKFSLTAGINEDEQNYTINVASKYAVQSLYAGVALNWTIFDGFASRSAVRSSIARVRQLEVDYRAVDEYLSRTAESQAKSLGFVARFTKISDQQLESNEGNLSLRREEFGRGVISEEAVRMAEIGLVDARISAFGARADYYTNLCEFLGTVVNDPVLANIPQQ